MPAVAGDILLVHTLEDTGVAEGDILVGDGNHSFAVAGILVEDTDVHNPQSEDAQQEHLRFGRRLS